MTFKPKNIRPDKWQKNNNPQKETIPAETDLIWGINPILEYIKTKPDQIKEIGVLQSKSNSRVQQIIDLARQNNIKLQFKTSLNVPNIGQHINHQGVVAKITTHPFVDLEELLARTSEESQPPFFLALDSIQDPHNLGAIIRSAGAAGVSGIIIPRDRSASLSGTTAKVSAGAIAHVTVCMVTNLVNALKKLKETNVWVVGSDTTSDIFYEKDLTGPICLVIGSEGKGLRPLVKEQCDFLVSIPMQSSLDSLNASVAASILLFEVVRQRHHV
jgi:23S rRNA (guanosine2251-2'-O)-methyltransferase